MAISSGSSSGLLIRLRNSENRDIPQLLVGHAGQDLPVWKRASTKAQTHFPIGFATATTKKRLRVPRARSGEPRSLAALLPTPRRLSKHSPSLCDPWISSSDEPTAVVLKSALLHLAKPKALTLYLILFPATRICVSKSLASGSGYQHIRFR